jgi:hypothetical protein
MTKVYDALKRADALRKRRAGSDAAPVDESLTWDPKLRVSDEHAADAKSGANGGNGGSAGDLGKLREIVFGDLLGRYGQELARLENRIAAEATQIREELGQLGRRIEDRVAEIDTRAVKEQTALREQILAQSNKLKESIREHGEKASKLVDEGLTELRASKIDQGTFAGFLRDLAAHVDATTKAAPTDSAKSRS